MKTIHGIILAGILCVMLIAAGCTSSSPATTTTATTAAATITTAAPANTPAETTPAVTVTPAPRALSWAGTWNTTWLESDGNRTVSVLSLTQAGTTVSGNFSYTYPGEGNYTGSLNATLQGDTITGTYAETDNDTGSIAFILSEDGNAFTGKWAHATGNYSDLKNSTLFWNGVRQ